jgi:hypothetical protein
MPDLWENNPDNVVNTPDQRPDPAPRDHEDHAEVRLKDGRGKLRFPAYVLIALVLALAAITVAIVAALAGFR